MHKYQLLRLRAEEFRVVLEKYAKEDKDVEWFLEKWMLWYERIQRREIRLPCYEYKLGIYFSLREITPNFLTRYVAVFTKDSGWKDLMHPLGYAESNFSAAILDRLSQSWYLRQLRSAGEEPELVPDEPPPPDEETPLTEPVKEPEKQGWLQAFIHKK